MGFGGINAPETVELGTVKVYRSGLMSGFRNRGRIYKMDLWKLQLIVVTVCALVQTYRGMSFRVDEDRGLSTEWQVKICEFHKTNKRH